jgi:hypothetical protein
VPVGGVLPPPAEKRLAVRLALWFTSGGAGFVPMLENDVIAGCTFTVIEFVLPA